MFGIFWANILTLISVITIAIQVVYLNFSISYTTGSFLDIGNIFKWLLYMYSRLYLYISKE